MSWVPVVSEASTTCKARGTSEVSVESIARNVTSPAGTFGSPAFRHRNLAQTVDTHGALD
jgi:hypothetical protein